MKNKVTAVIAVFLALCIFSAVLILIAGSRGMGISEGLYLRTANNSHMIIMGSSPVVMSAKGPAKSFDRFDNGDRILILHNGIQESYPGGTAVYAAIKLENGSASDLPGDVLDALANMGWLTPAGENTEPAENTAAPEDEKELDCAHHVCYVNWSDDAAVFDKAINKEHFTQSSLQHLPLYRIDDGDDYQSFFSDFFSILELESDYNGEPGFCELTEHCREEFFEDNSLLIVYISANSGSLRFDLSKVVGAGDELAILVKQVNNPEICTDDMAGWFLTVEFNKSDIERYNSITAYFEMK